MINFSPNLKDRYIQQNNIKNLSADAKSQKPNTPVNDGALSLWQTNTITNIKTAVTTHLRIVHKTIQKITSRTALHRTALHRTVHKIIQKTTLTIIHLKIVHKTILQTMQVTAPKISITN